MNRTNAINVTIYLDVNMREEMDMTLHPTTTPDGLVKLILQEEQEKIKDKINIKLEEVINACVESEITCFLSRLCEQLSLILGKKIHFGKSQSFAMVLGRNNQVVRAKYIIGT